MSLALDQDYRSSGGCVSSDFLSHVLSACKSYKRAAGFFSSSVFNVQTAAWSTFFEGGGTMQLVCSPRFSGADLAAIKSCFVDRPRWRRKALRDVLREEQGKASSPSTLSWLLATGSVSLKIAFLRGGVSDYRMYHEKIGIFEDETGAAIAISGSVNESWTAWIANFERLDVFRSWGESDEHLRYSRIELAFRALWLNETHGLEVLDVRDALIQGRLEQTSSHTIGMISEAEELPTERVEPELRELFAPPTGLRLFPHQQQAIRAWAGAQGRGVLEMATGSGKTITALQLASSLYDATGPGLVIFIVAPLIHLVDQWIDVAHRFGLRPIRCAEGLRFWRSELSACIDSVNSERRGVLSIAVTATSLLSEAFQSQIRRIRKPILLIGDEVHNYGAPAYITALPQNATYRVGLSATPDRVNDPLGTARIREYFGESAIRYSLADAIRDDVLTHYVYYPNLVPFSDEEFEEYRNISRTLSRYFREGSEDSDLSEPVKALLLKRARVVATARGKLAVLKDLIRQRKDDDHILVYCGDGSVEGPDSGELVSQVEAVTRMLGQELGMRCASYTAKTSPARRKELLEEFDRGFLQVLVAIRCLDEGVDVPSTKTAYILASSTNPRQFIQRRGRVLRRFLGKARAEIFDFFVTPPPYAVRVGADEYGTARSLVRSQVERAAEFASLADNGPVARRHLSGLLADLHLLDTWEKP